MLFVKICIIEFIDNLYLSNIGQKQVKIKKMSRCLKVNSSVIKSARVKVKYSIFSDIDSNSLFGVVRNVSFFVHLL